MIDYLHISNPYSVRVSNELGAGNPKSAAFSVVVVTVMSFIISVIAAIIILCLRDYISYAFTEGEVVARAVSDLCPLLATTLILNGIQPVLSGGRGQEEVEQVGGQHGTPSILAVKKPMVGYTPADLGRTLAFDTA
ncbi:hypothetical protein BHE74_00030225 [Ensete ventricosum]|nr:hypothetical protein BHE74_00030225 [Ensete ventricosum]RZS14634.1 hypothetical protein BHM03_00046350 [Ensete ventricosum]